MLRCIDHGTALEYAGKLGGYLASVIPSDASWGTGPQLISQKARSVLSRLARPLVEGDKLTSVQKLFKTTGSCVQPSSTEPIVAKQSDDITVNRGVELLNGLTTAGLPEQCHIETAVALGTPRNFYGDGGGWGFKTFAQSADDYELIQISKFPGGDRTLYSLTIAYNRSNPPASICCICEKISNESSKGYPFSYLACNYIGNGNPLAEAVTAFYTKHMEPRFVAN